MGDLVPFPDRQPVAKPEGRPCRKCGKPIGSGTLYVAGPEHVGACPSGTFVSARVEFFGPAWPPGVVER